MNKKEALLVAVMGIITAAVIMFGYNYSSDRREELAQGDHTATQSQSEAFKERKLQEEEEDKAVFLGAFEKNREKATVADFLQYINYNKEAVTVVYYGAIAENAAWADAGLSQVAQGRDVEKVSRYYVPLEGDAALTDHDLVAEVTAHQPDVVFLALPELTDSVDPAMLAEAEREIFQAYDAIKTGVPETLIVLLSPAPSAEESIGESGMDSTLPTYITHMQNASEENGVGFYNLHAKVVESVEAVGGEMNNLFDEGQALNQEGSQFLQDAFSWHLQETVVDTSHAFQMKGEQKPAESLVPEESSSEESESLESSSEEPAAKESEQSSLESTSLESVSSKIESIKPTASEEAARAKAESEQAARAKAASEEAARAKAASEEAARAKAASEEAARAKAASEEAARAKAASEEAARKKAESEQAAREQESREQESREQESREQESREQASSAEESTQQSTDPFYFE